MSVAPASVDDSPPPSYPGVTGFNQHPGSSSSCPDYPPSIYTPYSTDSAGVTRPVPFGDIPLARVPQNLTCPGCRANVITRVSFKSGPGACLACVAVALFGLWCGCCYIPFCIDETKDAHHFCPNCNGLIGIKEAIQM